MYQNLKKKTEGFTIIEVLIVLAIAGLVMLIVFLAVPALQRNGRNNGRNADASRIAAAMQECLSNRNNNPDACTAAEINSLAGTRSQLITFTLAAGTGSISAANGVYGQRCTNGRDLTGGGRTDYAVRFQLEGQGGTVQRCVGTE